jgi:hypothetical protein
MNTTRGAPMADCPCPAPGPKGSTMAPVQTPARILWAALALGWATDILFYGKPLGISVPLFVGLALAALFGLGRREGVAARRANLWLLAPIGFFAAMIFVRANTTLTVLNSVALLGLLGLLVYFYAGGRLGRLGLLGYPTVLGLVGKHLMIDPVAPVAGVREAVRPNPRTWRRAAPVLRGVALAGPVLFVFAALLASADSVFAGLLGDLLQLNFLTSLPELLWRLALIGGAAWIVAGGLFYALRRRRAPDDAPPGAYRPGFSLGFFEGATVLALVNGLFLVFNWIQVTYLFSGEAARTLDYAAYREYVRRGFGELLVVAVLTMILILGLRWAAWKETPREGRILNGLSTLMIGLALLLLGSAFMRMVVWEDITYYINTELRIYVRWFIGWLGVAFLWLLGTLWTRPERFAIGGFVVALGFLVSINLVNPDADVAAYNLARNDELSTRYLYLLSADAVPALAAGLDRTTGEVQQRLRDDLARRLWTMEHDPTWQAWPAFHLARWDAYRTLTALQAAGKLDTASATR